MKTIEYRAIYSGVTHIVGGVLIHTDPSEEVIKVRTRSINSGFTKALKIALQPLGNGTRRELTSLQFWQVI